ncbi:MAG: SHOCT domain-containing protein [Methanobacterium sp.]|nr:SHOCT domain-containing protein [Methanobacterium sp.]
MGNLNGEIKVRNIVKTKLSTKKIENGPGTIEFTEEAMILKRKSMLRKELPTLTIYFVSVRDFKFNQKSFTKLPNIEFNTPTDSYQLVFKKDKEIKAKIDEYAEQLYKKSSPTPVTEPNKPKLLKGLPDSDNTRFKVVLREVAPGRLSTHNNKQDLIGVVEIADEELIIYKKSVVRKKDRGIKHLRYDQITSIDYDAPKTLGSGAIQIYLSSIEYSLMSKDKALEHYYNLIREKMNSFNQIKAQSQVQNLAPTPQEANPLESLKKLGELKDLGVITEEEFEEKKKTLLDQI